MVSGAATTAMLLAVFGASLASSIPAAAAAPGALPAAKTFVYTGGEQAYTVPAGVTLLTVVADGAIGGGVLTGYEGGAEAITAYLPVTPKEQLFTEVGEPGAAGGGSTFGGGGAPGAGYSGFGAPALGAGRPMYEPARRPHRVVPVAARQTNRDSSSLEAEVASAGAAIRALPTVTPRSWPGTPTVAPS
jgi:hypothetical protein